jgi:ATP-dependent DNA ligase
VKKEADPAARKYEDFLNSKKQEVDKELKMQRTNSSEKRLSANKSRVTSPSPKKKRWEDSGQEEEKPAPKLAPAPAPVLKPAESEKKQKISLTTPNMRPPMIPHSKPLPVTVITTTAAKEPKKTESAKDPSPRLEETLPLIDTVNSSVTSLP